MILQGPAGDGPVLLDGVDGADSAFLSIPGPWGLLKIPSTPYSPLVNVNKKLWTITMLFMGQFTIFLCWIFPSLCNQLPGRVSPLRAVTSSSQAPGREGMEWRQTLWIMVDHGSLSHIFSSLEMQTPALFWLVVTGTFFDFQFSWEWNNHPN